MAVELRVLWAGLMYLDCLSTMISHHNDAQRLSVSTQHEVDDEEPHPTRTQSRPHHLSRRRRLLPRNFVIRVLSLNTDLPILRLGQLASHWTCAQSHVSARHAVDRSRRWRMGSDLEIQQGALVFDDMLCAKVRPTSCESMNPVESDVYSTCRTFESSLGVSSFIPMTSRTTGPGVIPSPSTCWVSTRT